MFGRVCPRCGSGVDTHAYLVCLENDECLLTRGQVVALLNSVDASDMMLPRRSGAYNV